MRKFIIFLVMGLTAFGAVVSTTDSPGATAMNNGRKIRFFSNYNDIGLVYAGYDSVWSAYSPGNGSLWTNAAIYKGYYPSLARRTYYYQPFSVNPQPLINEEWDVVWKREAGLQGHQIPERFSDSLWLYKGRSGAYFDEAPSNWSISTIDSDFVSGEIGGAIYSPPAIENDGTNNHVVWEETIHNLTNSGDYYSWKLYYAQFDEYWNLVTKEVIDSIISYESWVSPLSPAITCDNNHYPHVVYYKHDSVFYSTRDSTGEWSPPYCLSISGRVSGEPFINYWGDHVRAVWMEEDPSTGLGVLYTRIRLLTKRPDDWEGGYPAQVKWQDLTKDNHWAQVVADTFYTWSERDTATGDWDVVVGGYFDSNDPVNSRYSQIDYSNNGYLAAAWTKGNTEPYAVVETTLTVPVVTYYAVSVGDSTPSPYTVYRDGYIVYPSGVAVDYAENALEYNLPYLNPQYSYTLVVIGYHESTGKWNELLKIDGKEGRVLKVNAGTPDTVSMYIPLVFYKGDNAVDLTIKRLTGDYATVSAIYLYQKPRKTPGLGGPQLLNAEIPSTRFYARLISNPSRSIATIEYSLRNRTNVNLRIYDIAGRLVGEPINKEMEAGIHRINWTGNASGIYFYRLKAGKETATGKIILVK